MSRGIEPIDGDNPTTHFCLWPRIWCRGGALPRHTPGHVVFVQREAKIAFCGDVLFKGSIGRTDFPRGNHATLIHSIVDKLWPLGGDIAFVPGHGPMSSFAEERRSNPFVSDSALDGML